jgi:hypothetical protein
MKRCSGCKETKPTTEFYKSKDRKDGLDNYCKPCKKQFIARYRTEKYDAYLRSTRKSQRKMRYGITPEEYDAILASQGGVCAICKEELNEFKNTCLDHDHESDRVRGILCSHCNRGLGQFRDNVEFLSAAINYLKNN